MADPFLAEIRMFPFNFAPSGWAFCDGQLMPISQNTALFSLLGTTYGGDGKTTFALPNLQGRAAMQPGQGSGLSWYDLGQTGGTEAITLLVSEIPLHAHTVMVAAGRNTANNFLPGPSSVFAPSVNAQAYFAGTPATTTMAVQSLSPAGGNLPHNNMQPYLTVSFCIAMQGVFPPRS